MWLVLLIKIRLLPRDFKIITLVIYAQPKCCHKEKWLAEYSSSGARGRSVFR